MDPINYALNVQNPVTSLFQGMGQAQQQQLADQQIQQNSFAMQQAQQQAAMQAQAQQQQQARVQQMHNDFADFAGKTDKSASDYSNLILRYPEMADKLTASWQTLEPSQKQAKQQQLAQFVTAMKSGNTALAKNMMQGYFDAAKNSGDTQTATALNSLIKNIDNDPRAVLDQTSLILAANSDPKEFASVLSSATNAEQAQAKLPGELQAQQAGIGKTQAETAKTFDSIESQKLDRKIAVLDAQIKSADSETKRGELQVKRDKLAQDREEMMMKTGKDQTSLQNDAQSKLMMYDQNLETVDKVLNSPVMNAFFGVGSVGGKIASWIPGTENRDFDALLQTVKSQQFLSNIQQMKAAGGAGALSDAEGKKLDAAVASIDRDQSPESLKSSLNTIKSVLEASKRRVISDPNLPTKGGAFVMNHPQFGQVTEGTINQLLKDHPGSTRGQIMQYLQQTGGK